MIKRRTFDKTPFIKFRWEIELSSGIIGKEIEYNGLSTNYIITKDAKVFKIDTEEELNIFKGKYKSTSIRVNGKPKTVLIHRLLGMGFIQNPLENPIINHKDGVKYNLDLSNLEWSTYSENNKHAFDIGLKNPSKVASEKCNLTTHSVEDVKNVCDMLIMGYPPIYISRVYGYSIDFVRDIQKRKTWKDYTKNMDFNNICTYVKGLTPEEIFKFEELFENGCTVKEAIYIMGYKYNETIRGRIRQIKKRIDKKYREDQVKPL